MKTLAAALLILPLLAQAAAAQCAMPPEPKTSAIPAQPATQPG
jgi:opacity protein-like surface antigen